MNVQSVLKLYKSAIVPLCCKNDCKLNTVGSNNIVVLDIDRLSDDVRSDCLVFQLQDNKLNIGICEMKSKDQKANKIIQQLTASGNLALTICHKHFPKINYQIIFILLVKSYKSSAHTILSGTRIKIEGKKRHIRLHKCGDKFQHIVNKENQL